MEMMNRVRFNPREAVLLGHCITAEAINMLHPTFEASLSVGRESDGSVASIFVDRPADPYTWCMPEDIVSIVFGGEFHFGDEALVPVWHHEESGSHLSLMFSVLLDLDDPELSEHPWPPEVATMRVRGLLFDGEERPEESASAPAFHKMMAKADLNWQ